jgi:predicted nucleotidyltransferase
MERMLNKSNSLKQEIHYSLSFARQKERKEKTKEATIRVYKLIYQLKAIDNIDYAKQWKEEKKRNGYTF